MPHLQSRIMVETARQGLYEVTSQAEALAREAGFAVGLMNVFVRHTSCSLLIQENADPDVRRDLVAFFARLVPSADDPAMAWITHRQEGRDDMPAHIKAALTAVSLTIPITEGRLALGTWQSIYLFEHRDRPHRREIVLHAHGER